MKSHLNCDSLLADASEAVHSACFLRASECLPSIKTLGAVPQSSKGEGCWVYPKSLRVPAGSELRG